MLPLQITLSFAVLLAIILGAYSVYLSIQLRKSRIAGKQVHTIEAQQLLSDLLSRGNAVIRLEVLNTSDLFLRSPRN